jgi:hypothetical protein
VSVRKSFSLSVTRGSESGNWLTETAVSKLLVPAEGRILLWCAVCVALCCVRAVDSVLTALDCLVVEPAVMVEHQKH